MAWRVTPACGEDDACVRGLLSEVNMKGVIFMRSWWGVLLRVCLHILLMGLGEVGCDCAGGKCSVWSVLPSG